VWQIYKSTLNGTNPSEGINGNSVKRNGAKLPLRRRFIYGGVRGIY
jgi:hypothetical protein